MQLKVEQQELLQALQFLSGVVEKRQTMPILSHLLLVAEDNLLTLTASDLQLEITTQLPANITTQGSTTAPARKLLDICRGLQEDNELAFSSEGEQLKIQAGKSRFSLATLAPEDFPKQEPSQSGQPFRIPQRALRKLLERTYFAMARQDVRYYLNGLLFSIRNDSVRVVATDGHRLAMCEIPQETGIENEMDVILPRKSVLELRRLLNNEETPAEVTVSDNQLQLAFNTISFTTKLVDGRFPDYKRVIPGVGNKRLKGDRNRFHTALSRTAILSNEKFRGVRLQLGDGILILQAQNPEHEEAIEELEVNYEGENLEIGFNVNYLLDALMAMETEEFTLEMTNADSSGLLKEVGDDTSQYVVMPMRL